MPKIHQNIYELGLYLLALGYVLFAIAIFFLVDDSQPITIYSTGVDYGDFFSPHKFLYAFIVCGLVLLSSSVAFLFWLFDRHVTFIPCGASALFLLGCSCNCTFIFLLPERFPPPQARVEHIDSQGFHGRRYNLALIRDKNFGTCSIKSTCNHYYLCVCDLDNSNCDCSFVTSSEGQKADLFFQESDLLYLQIDRNLYLVRNNECHTSCQLFTLIESKENP